MLDHAEGDSAQVALGQICDFPFKLMYELSKYVRKIASLAYGMLRLEDEVEQLDLKLSESKSAIKPVNRRTHDYMTIIVRFIFILGLGWGGVGSCRYRQRNPMCMCVLDVLMQGRQFKGKDIFRILAAAGIDHTTVRSGHP